MSDDYLWDRKGPPDPEVAALEDLMASLRLPDAARTAPGSSVAAPRARWNPLPLAAAAALLVALFVGLPRPAPDAHPGSGWAFARSDGSTGTLAPGTWLETRRAETRLEVAEIGHVLVAPDSRVKLVHSQTDEHRIHLAEGRIDAWINAPPRLFITETPASTAVDLGCAYRLEVDKAGNGFLHVSSGYVALESPDPESGAPASVVPWDAQCRIRADQGAGTPHFDTASPVLRRALDRFDFHRGGRSALREVLAEARARDTLTLWHLLQAPGLSAEDRREVLDAVQALTPLPPVLDETLLLSRDAESLDRLFDHLQRWW